MIPTPQRDNTGRPIVHRAFEINRDQLLHAFDLMATYLQQRRASLTIYVAGGTVNTILLRSRHTTGDVDFFGANDQARLLKEASKYAQQQSKAQLGANWFNNSMSLFLTRDVERELLVAAQRQNAVIFNKPGLKVYAVPWDYALCGKIDRLSKPDYRPYDISDAVAYLDQLVRSNGGHAVQASWVAAMAKKYGKAHSREVVGRINAAFKKTYGKDGIV